MQKPFHMKKTRFNLPAVGLCMTVYLLANTGRLFADPTGNPATDAGWTAEGLSTSPGNLLFQTGTFSVNLYSIAFTLASGSALAGTVGGAGGLTWNAGDTIVGVGGVFTSTNNSSVGASLRYVVKYGTSAETWMTGSAANASLSLGGNGSVLLGTGLVNFTPTSGFLTTSDAPTEETASGQVGLPAIDGDLGQVITSWSGSSLTGFESFMDLTLLTNTIASANVALGDHFILDLQEGSGVLQDSLGTLPTTVIPVPEPASVGCFLLGLGILGCYQRLKMRRQV
jgi:hypothetical protein